MAMFNSVLDPYRWRLARKTITYTGAAGAGAVGTVSVFSVTGDLEISAYYEKCTTNLVGAATLNTGIAAQTSLLTAQTIDTSEIDAGEWNQIRNATWGVGVGVNGLEQLATSSLSSYPNPVIAISQNIIQTVGADDITGGVIVAYCWWRPLSAGATLVAA